ncbi:DUF397 domain-containing protein [Streptomyces sp. Amel2xC10]|uniref:DUF397 domain-containing protein n=1 Tax=Streptomyces sp. Amel2xC10 TaxID=1305826 RepID=UPI000A083BF5|nr:DUF397 domain-containing protein [Streptomyces sp. Amel2xC10]SMF06758.1 protein of unknown function [Streptomyces sp. Amel2xC10]
MSQLTWQKSSFSSGGEGNCVELAASVSSRIHLRESDDPHHTTATTPHALAHLIHAVKRGNLRT